MPVNSCKSSKLPNVDKLLHTSYMPDIHVSYSDTCLMAPRTHSLHTVHNVLDGATVAIYTANETCGDLALFLLV